MSDIKLFSLQAGQVTELASKSALLEKHLQEQIEQHMEVFLGVRFLATEYSTGKTHKGRIDSLGLDENGCPVIVEYKRHSNENVINQGLFYLDWLLDHQAEFKWLVMEKLGKDAADDIEWGGTRLICIASDFNRYDEHAVQQINRNIELMRYRYFGSDLLLLELVNAQTASGPIITELDVDADVPEKKQTKDKSQRERLSEASSELLALYNSLCQFTEQLGDEVQRKELKHYTAFKRIRNFAAFIVMPGKKDPRIQVYLKLPGTRAQNDDFSRDVSNIGHWGSGDLELTVRSAEDVEKAKGLIQECYLGS
ncbi:MAG: endonuclease NucS [Gammaproteobacteria bacterium]